MELKGPDGERIRGERICGACIVTCVGVRQVGREGIQTWRLCTHRANRCTNARAPSRPCPSALPFLISYFSLFALLSPSCCPLTLTLTFLMFLRSSRRFKEWTKKSRLSFLFTLYNNRNQKESPHPVLLQKYCHKSKRRNTTIFMIKKSSIAEKMHKKIVEGSDEIRWISRHWTVEIVKGSLSSRRDIKEKITNNTKKKIAFRLLYFTIVHLLCRLLSDSFQVSTRPARKQRII